MNKYPLIFRDISWLSFNARLLQEAADPSVPLRNRIHFLAIHSNNLDEFFSLRVPALKAQIKAETKLNNVLAVEEIQNELNEINSIVIQQQAEFSEIWQKILTELNKQKIYLLNENQLSAEQRKFIKHFYETEVSSNIVPLFVESLPPASSIWAKNSFLGVVMRSKNKTKKKKYAIIQIPTKTIGRFILLPSDGGRQDIILLEDVIRYSLPSILSYFGYDTFEAYMFKVNLNAEIDLDSDLSSSYIQKIMSGINNRRKAEPISFLYDKAMNPNLLRYLIKWLHLTKKDRIIPRGRIRNFRDFLKFPAKLPKKAQHKPFNHPLLASTMRVSDVVLKQDVLICPPYHSFNAVIDMLREAAINPYVRSIKITLYRLAKDSLVCNALMNAARNGKKVHVVIEIKATFNEEDNIYWKNRLEEEGVKVYLGVPNLKVHAKLCVIKMQNKNKKLYYGFISTGNLNEDTALVYSDYCLLTSNANIMSDINHIFKALKKKKIEWRHLDECKTLLVSPVTMRPALYKLIEREIAHKQQGKAASIKLEINSLTDKDMIFKLYEAADAGVDIHMVLRVMCAVPNQKRFKKNIKAISIVDEYLEHGRAWVFHNNGEDDTYIASADWMVRNLDHRIEVAVKITDPAIKRQIIHILNLKFIDNVKARILDNNLTNAYVHTGTQRHHSQLEIYDYLHQLAEAYLQRKKGK